MPPRDDRDGEVTAPSALDLGAGRREDAICVDRWIGGGATPEDRVWEHQSDALRPKRFADYPGQDRAKGNLAVYVEAARRRGRAMDHVLLHGPPGLGKTTLARVIAHELGVRFLQTSGPAIEKPRDLLGILANLEPNSLLFIDEIHRLTIQAEEVLYSAMEDFRLDMLVGQGALARTESIPLAPFTLVGATTRVAMLSTPLQSRFGIQERLEFYDEVSLVAIVQRTAEVSDMDLRPDAAVELARRCRGTPRVVNRLLRRVWDFAEVQGGGHISVEIVHHALQKLGIDRRGLDSMDRRLLEMIRDRYGRGPVGLDTLAANLGEDRGTIEEFYEPFLVHLGLVARTPRGRILTDVGVQHLHSVRSMDL